MSTHRNYQEIYERLFGQANSQYPTVIDYPTFESIEPKFQIPGVNLEDLSDYEQSLKLSTVIDDAATIDNNSPESLHSYVQVAISIFLFKVCCGLVIGLFPC